MRKKMATKQYAYIYEFRFVMDEAGQPHEYSTAAFSFMKAYQRAVRDLRKKKGKRARQFKLESMERF